MENKKYVVLDNNDFPIVDKESPFCLDTQSTIQLTQQFTSYIDYYQMFLENKYQKTLNFSNDENKAQRDVDNFNQTVLDVTDKLKNVNNTNLLVYGFIQSGKTDFIIGSIMKLLTNNQQKILIIVITSNMKELINQTKERFDNQANQLNLVPIIEILGFKELKKESTVDKSTVIFLGKNSNHLKRANQFIKANKFDKIVIFDDEGDKASFNDWKK